MSYVNLHADFPPSLDGVYEDCLARVDALRAEYERAKGIWAQKNASYQAYKKADAEWVAEAKRRGALAAQRDASYAAAVTSYNANLKKWQAAMAQYNADLAYNKALHNSDASRRAQVESKYGIKFPSDVVCASQAQHDYAARMCMPIKGLGQNLNFDFQIPKYPACAVAELNVCRPRRTLKHPGNEPRPPSPPEPVPKMPSRPPAVPDPGPKPVEPAYERCVKPGGGGIATFGLITVLAVGAGALGYRAYKKRKKAA